MNHRALVLWHRLTGCTWDYETQWVCGCLAVGCRCGASKSSWCDDTESCVRIKADR